MKHELLPLAAPRQSGRSGGGGSEGTRRGSSKKKTFSDKAGAAFEVCVDKCVDLCGSGMYWVGPVFVFTGLAIITFAMYVGFGILLPAKDTSWSWTWILRGIFGSFLTVNVVYNYVACVMSDPGSHKSPLFERALREGYARGAIVDPQGASASRRAAQKGGWMHRGPFEWGVCRETNKPKPPRSHFDNVTNKLVLNMDHYCPWMFNTVGYANYRYFVLFLFYVWLGTWYLAAEAYGPFMNERAYGLHRSRDFGNPASLVTLFFALMVAVGAAITILLVWHLYLVTTAQTTIEFWGNRTLASRAREQGKTFTLPYSQGCLKNWQNLVGQCLDSKTPTVRSFVIEM
eukprot:INCI9200.6.p1 GENE.INCI9200.6~~INCI9200.6.p1  ORF type:complete len:344 (-),score=28.62 INCI9200.6:450-1481(-)